jgi:hypothetical protein
MMYILTGIIFMVKFSVDFVVIFVKYPMLQVRVMTIIVAYAFMKMVGKDKDTVFYCRVDSEGGKTFDTSFAAVTIGRRKKCESGKNKGPERTLESGIVGIH